MQNSYFYDCLVVLLWGNCLRFPIFWDSMDLFSERQRPVPLQGRYMTMGG